MKMVRCKFGLNLKDPGALARSQWPIPKSGYLVYRYLFMLYLVVCDTISVSLGAALVGARQLLYLTFWSFQILTLYGIVGALSTAVYGYRTSISSAASRSSSSGRAEEGFHNHAVVISDDDAVEMQTTDGGKSEEVEGKPSTRASDQGTSNQAPDPLTPWYLKLSWVLFNINVMVAPLVTLVYWSVLHDYSPPEEGEVRNPLNFFDNLNVHAINSVLIILDLFVSAHPIRILHWIHGVAFSFLFIIFTVIYWAAGGVNPWGGTAIYPTFLDWGEIPWLSCAYTVALLLVLGVIQCIAYVLYRLRLYISVKCCQKRKSVDISTK